MDEHPPIAPVRVRIRGASHEGPRRESNDDAFGSSEDDAAALAVVADGMGAQRSGRPAADLTVDACLRMFRGRSKTVLDDLAEVWWRGEHGEPGAGGVRVRPYSALPIADRVGLRERVRDVLARRVPESHGDIAVLEEELRSLLAIPARALGRANAEIYRFAESDAAWRGDRAAAACVVFAGAQAAVAHVGDCRVSRVRGFEIEALTQEHTLGHEYRAARPEMTSAELAALPADVITRVLGIGDSLRIDASSFALEPGDVFVLATDGLWELFPTPEIVAAVRARGTGAAPYLVARGARDRPGHVGDNLTAVIVEVIEIE